MLEDAAQSEFMSTDTKPTSVSTNSVSIQLLSVVGEKEGGGEAPRGTGSSHLEAVSNITSR